MDEPVQPSRPRAKMPTRKYHTKSRYGCDGCRRRKVKCDEQGPPCNNCIVHEMDNCTYSRIPPARRMALARQAASPSTTESTIGPPLSKVVDELELMHMFSTQTYQSLSVNDTEFPVWQMEVPRLALEHRYLMDGLLAFAAIHIATTMDDRNSAGTPRSRYIDAGLQYHSRSLGPFRSDITAISPRNCNAVFAQSVIVVATSIAMPQVMLVRHGTESIAESSGQSMIETVLTIFELLQGVKKILAAGHCWISVELFSNGEFWRKDEVGSAGDLDPMTDAALHALADISERQASGKGADVEGRNSHVQKRTVSHLRHCFIKFARSPDPAPVLAWLAAVDERFVRDVQERRPLALLVLTFWGVLLAKLEGRRWWAHKSGGALVTELLPILDMTLNKDDGWDVCLDWICRQVDAKS